MPEGKQATMQQKPSTKEVPAYENSHTIWNCGKALHAEKQRLEATAHVPERWDELSDAERDGYCAMARAVLVEATRSV